MQMKVGFFFCCCCVAAEMTQAPLEFRESHLVQRVPFPDDFPTWPRANPNKIPIMQMSWRRHAKMSVVAGHGGFFTAGILSCPNSNNSNNSNNRINNNKR